MHDIGILYSRRRFLHEPLQHALGAVAVHFHLDAFELILKIVRDRGGRRQREGRIPNDLSFFSRRLNQRGILSRNQRSDGKSPGENDEANTDLFHDCLLIAQLENVLDHYCGISLSVNVTMAGISSSRFTMRTISSTVLAGSASFALPRNFSSISSGGNGSSKPPRG